MVNKIFIAINKKDIEKEIHKIVKDYVKKLVDYPYVKSVFYNELRKFAKSKGRRRFK